MSDLAFCFVFFGGIILLGVIPFIYGLVTDPLSGKTPPKPDRIHPTYWDLTEPENKTSFEQAPLHWIVLAGLIVGSILISFMGLVVDSPTVIIAGMIGVFFWLLMMVLLRNCRWYQD